MEHSVTDAGVMTPAPISAGAKAGSVARSHSGQPTKIAEECWGASARRRHISTFLMAPPFPLPFGGLFHPNVYSVMSQNLPGLSSKQRDSGRDFRNSDDTAIYSDRRIN